MRPDKHKLKATKAWKKNNNIPTHTQSKETQNHQSYSQESVDNEDSEEIDYETEDLLNLIETSSINNYVFVFILKRIRILRLRLNSQMNLLLQNTFRISNSVLKRYSIT